MNSKKNHDFKKGDKVMCNGYEGRVISVLDWSDSMIEVRLESGDVCVDGTDEKTVIKR